VVAFATDRLRQTGPRTTRLAFHSPAVERPCGRSQRFAREPQARAAPNGTPAS
jgi:hypothetical protein